jgi:hypothetical protein
MAIEEEFSVEIPDAEADEITSVGQGKSRAHDLGCPLTSQPSTTLPRYAHARFRETSR